MALEFIYFIIIFAGLNIFLDVLRLKFFSHYYGFDFLFFTPFLAGAIYGIFEGIIAAVVMLTVHVILSPQKIVFMFGATPGLVIAILLGAVMGVSGFWIALIVYLIINSFTTLILRGFGGGFVIFLGISIFFNTLLFFFAVNFFI